MSYTNTALATFRRCPHEFELRYDQQLERDGDEREVLQVGQTWHKAHEAKSKVTTGLMTSTGTPDDAGFAAIFGHAPSAKWNTKLARLFAAYAWFWESQPIETIEPEQTFKVKLGDDDIEGQLDGIIKIDGRIGIHEYKTSGEDIAVGASYWNRLTLDVQTPLYFLAARAMGYEPEFILYDVTRKPTIRVKSLTKVEASRMALEMRTGGSCSYFAESFTDGEAEEAIASKTESLGMYGARLTADIGTRPGFYFQRIPVNRTEAELENLIRDVQGTIGAIEFHRERAVGFPRNPNACDAFGLCDFFSLCSHNNQPIAGQPAPDGFRRREHLHPELA